MKQQEANQELETISQELESTSRELARLQKEEQKRLEKQQEVDHQQYELQKILLLQQKQQQERTQEEKALLSFIDMVSDTLNIMSSTSYITGHAGVDLRLENMMTKIFSDKRMFNHQNYYQQFVSCLTICTTRFLSRREAIFWLRQVSYIFDEFMRLYPEVVGQYNLENNGLHDVLSCFINVSTPTIQQNFALKLAETLIELYKKVMDLTLQFLRTVLIGTVFRDHSVEPLERKEKLSEDHGHGHAHGHSNTLNSNLLKPFSKLLQHFERWKVYDSIIIKFFNEVYSNMDSMLWNELMAKPSLYCTAERGLHLKLALSHLQDWKLANLKKHLTSNYSNLSLIGKMPFITEAANLLVLDKNLFLEKSLVESLFPTIPLNSIYFLLLNFQPSKLIHDAVPSNVLQAFHAWGCAWPTDK
eukprot:TRINITY_DN8996_c0_g1_i1.p1 TRINITY_DN8996_c0_g1~~TRINITY_DN8996_c0_g1_i1.p1  ORF type:complete len:455 (+),score=106.94 TRINITY_DN8996_c0_g1_i1:120-1367(+)